MKTSYYLLLAAAVITLTGMVGIDVLLKQGYEKIDWSNQYQFFARRSLPGASHLVISGTPGREIIVEPGKEPMALVAPDDSLSFRFRMQHDTLFVSFNPDTTDHRSPRKTVGDDKTTGLLLRLPTLESVNAINARLTLQDRPLTDLTVSLQNSLLFANQLTVPASFQLTERQNSLAMLTKGSYKTMQLMLQDSSAIHVNDTRIDTFSPTLSDRAEVQFSGQSTRWVKQTGQ